MEIRRFAKAGWCAVLGAGALTFAAGMMQFKQALTASHHYDSVEAQARGRALAGRVLEPRAQVILLNVLGNLREDTHLRLATGLFGAAGGMSLLVLGQRGVRGQKRREVARIDEAVGCAGRDEFALGGRCATIAGVPRRASEGPMVGLRVAEPVDDEELALLARFEALERQVAASARG